MVIEHTRKCQRRLAPERAQTSHRTDTKDTLSREWVVRESSRGSRSELWTSEAEGGGGGGSEREESAMEEEEEREEGMVEEAVAGGRTSATDDASTSGLVKQLFDASIRRRVSCRLFFRSVDLARKRSLDRCEFSAKNKKRETTLNYPRPWKPISVIELCIYFRKAYFSICQIWWYSYESFTM